MRVDTKKVCVIGVLAAVGYVLSTFIWVPKMAPMQHFINVIAGVLLGPWGALACAALTGILRMLLNGSTILAVTGAVFGAFFAGLAYRLSKKVMWAVAGEVVGTGIISAIISVPIMQLMYGTPDLYWFTYIPFFIPSSLMGSILGYLVIRVLVRAKVVKLA